MVDRLKQSTAVHISIIVPIGPNDDAWQALLPQLETADACMEIILVFAQNAPSEIARTTSAGAQIQIVRSNSGRALQQNAGAKHARGQWLWFLHADSTLLSTLAIVLRAQDLRTLYFFELRFIHGPKLLLLNQIGVWLRTRLWGMPFGDQGFLLSSKLFQQLGGFDESLSAGEDHALAWRAHRAGVKVRPIGAPLGTSGRRYAKHGWLRTTWHYSRLAFAQAKSFKSANQR